MNSRNPAVPGLVQGPEWRLPRNATLSGRNKAEIETEAALILIVYMGTSEQLCAGATEPLRDDPVRLRRAWFGYSK